MISLKITHRLERSNVTKTIIRPNIINRNPPILRQASILKLLHPLKTSIRSLIIQRCCPIIAESATRASRLGRKIVCYGFHGSVEGVSAYDLVHVRGADEAGVDEGVEALDYELGAGETHHFCLELLCVCCPEKGEGGEGSPKHGDGL